MSETEKKEEVKKSERELSQEYTNMCAIVGDLAFRQKILESELAKHYNSLADLSRKVHEVKKEEET